MATIPTLATYNYVDANTQPLDATGTLTALPKNIATTNAYFVGFPNDQPSYTITSGASSSNLLSLSASSYRC